MTTGSVVTNSGRKIALNRTFKATPDYLTPTKFKVGTGTTTPSTSDTDLTTAITISGNPTKAFVSGYPVLDEVNNQVTFRCLVETTECNGNSITEFGLFNEDGTALCFSHAVFTAVTKTSSVQLTFVEKDKISA